jgi:hypothetical protein
VSDQQDQGNTPAVPEPGERIPDEWDALLDELPPATEDQGNAGHDLAKAAARRAQAVRLRLSGATYEQIAQVAGYSHKAAARNAVMRALTKVEAESVSELRVLENARLDADEMVLRAILQDASAPARTRIAAVDARLRLSARRSRLNGLDAPVQVALSAGVAADLQDALAEAEAVFVEGTVLSSEDERLEG